MTPELAPPLRDGSLKNALQLFALSRVDVRNLMEIEGTIPGTSLERSEVFTDPEEGRQMIRLRIPLRELGLSPDQIRALSDPEELRPFQVLAEFNSLRLELKTDQAMARVELVVDPFGGDVRERTALAIAGVRGITQGLKTLEP